MKYKLPTLTVVFLGVLAAATSSQTAPPRASATPAAASPVRDVAPATAPVAAPSAVSRAAASTATSGQQLVAAAAAQLDRYSAIEARLRQRINLYGHQLEGSGIYVQLLDEGDVLLRLELKVLIGDYVASLQQVVDHRFLWSQQDLPGEKQVQRVDVKRVRQAMAALPAGPWVDDGGQWLLRGGLPRLLWSLHAHFEFGEPQPMRMAGAPVWLVAGRWREEALQRVLASSGDRRPAPREAPGAARLPQQLPDEVQLVLGRDERWPLFPYRIEYRRTTPSSEESAEKGRGVSRTVTTLELLEVQCGGAVDKRLFEFHVGDQEITDLTPRVLEQFLGRAEPAVTDQPRED